MSKKQHSFMLVLALVAGLVGGAAFNYLVLGESVLAVEPGVQAMEKYVDKDMSRIVEAEQFRLVDKKGVTHAALFLARSNLENLPVLQFYEKRCLKAQLGYNVRGQMVLELWDNCKPSIRLGLNQTGEPHLTLYDEEGTPRTALGAITLKETLTGVVKKRPPSSLMLFGEDGKVIWQAP